MSRNRSSKINNINIQNKNGKTLVKTNRNSIQENNKIVFSFFNFKTESIQYKDFNNMYENEYETKKAVSDFFESLKIISGLTLDMLVEPGMKKQFHYNQFTNDKIIDRIEDILINGYKMNEYIVKNQFERTYFEFQFRDGKRVIGTRIENNIFSLLFLDPNHLVCAESSRNIKRKSLYKIPGLFSSKNEDYKASNTADIKEYLEEAIKEFEKNRNTTDLLNYIKDVIKL